MATVVDELVVKLGLDNSGFSKNTKKVDENLKGVKKNADQTQKSFSDMGVVVGRFFAVLGGATALRQFIKQTIESNAELSRFSKNIGESAQNISAFKQAAEVTGAKAESMAAAIEMISDAQKDLKTTGTTAMIPTLNYLGVGLTDVTGKAKPAIQVLTELNQAFSKMNRTDAYYHGKKLGLSPDLMNLMLKDPAYFKNLTKDLKNTTAITDKEATNSEKLSEAANEFMLYVKRAPSLVLGKMLPNAPANPNAPRGIRNNNPGNLNYAGQRGASKESGPNGRFAVFGSMSEGLDAMINQIGINAGRGKNTIRQMISTWAPSSENDTQAYINFVSKRLGIGPDQTLDMNNQEQVKRLVMAIADKENGAGFVSEDQVKAAVSRAKNQKLSSAAKSSAAGVSGASQLSSAGASTANKTINVGDIIVHTQATDAKGTAAAVKESMYQYVYQADSGVK